MRVAVTGASGHVGATLVPALLAAGHEVRALYGSSARSLGSLRVDARRCDVRDASAVARELAGVELVFHLAARITIVGDPDGSVAATNVAGTANVARACLRHGARLVHFSSIHALEHDPWDRPLDETRPLADERPCLPYDRTKAGGERAVQAAIADGLDGVILNPTAVLGPNDELPSAMGAVALSILRRRLPALVDAGFDWVDVRDVVAGALAAAVRGGRGERYLLSGRWAPFAELARALAAEAGIRPPRLTSPLWLARAGAPFVTAWARVSGARPLATTEAMKTLAASHRDIRHDKAARELGYTARPLAETAAAVVASFREAGRLGPGKAVR
jgi:dihydroflavonol-4-reductase